VVSGTSGNLAFSAAASTQTGGTWLSVTPSAGLTPATLSVTAAPNGLLPGTYAGTITVSGINGATGSTAIPITLLVNSPPPVVAAVVNAASFQSGPVAPGEIVTIAGTALGPVTPATLTLDSTAKVSTNIGGVQVICQPGGIPAPLTYVSSTQINAVIPYELAGALNPTLQVKSGGQTSATYSLTSAPTALGVFTLNGSGSGPAAALNDDGSVNTPSVPASKGGSIVLYVTGEGQTAPSGITGKVTTVAPVVPLTPQPILPVSAQVGGQPAIVEFYGEAPGFIAGVMQVNIRIPHDSLSGNVPVQVSVGAGSTQPGVTIAIY
jgi:uncharacterized protein (TIGR03437 family)